MLKVKILSEKKVKGRTKVAFSIQEKQAHAKSEVLVILDDNQIADVDHPNSFTTFIFVEDNVSVDFANRVIENAKSLPLLVGMQEPEYSNLSKYKYVVLSKDNQDEFFEAEEKGNITEEILLEQMMEDDYMKDIYKTFSKHLPKIKNRNDDQPNF